MVTDKRAVKEPNLAGSWYPARSDALAREIGRLLEAVSPAGGCAPTGLVAPHAAYRYSGACAAAGYARLQGSSAVRVVVIAPSHRGRFRGAAVLPADGYATPLGTVGVDTETVAELSRHELINIDPAPFAQEHAIEIQLPFLQTVLPAARLVPVLIGALEVEDARELAKILRPALESAATVVVVSSDLTHYGSDFGYLPFPPTDEQSVRKGLRELDGGAVDLIVAGDADGLDAYVARTGATICGRAAIGVFLRARRARGHSEQLCYYTSLDVAGDHEHSVSYCSVAFWDQ